MSMRDDELRKRAEELLPVSACCGWTTKSIREAMLQLAREERASVAEAIAQEIRAQLGTTDRRAYEAADIARAHKEARS